MPNIELPSIQPKSIISPSFALPPSENGLNQINLDTFRKKQTQTLVDKKSSKAHTFIALGFSFSVLAIVIAAVLFVVFNNSKNAETYQFIQLTSSSAVCLDGSHAGYKVSTSGDPSKILIYFQGGAWCSDTTEENTLEACYQRSFTVIGTSSQENQKLSIEQGALSKDSNNYFKDWKKIIFHYCDGTGHQGSKKEPIVYKNRSLFFRGQNITTERFDDLEVKLGLFSKAEKVVITGESAGGLAAAMWTNYLAEKIQKGKVYSVVDAGVFYDSPNINTKTNLYKQKFRNLMKFSNTEIDLPVSECLKNFPNSKENCMLAQNFLQHIKVPLFVSQSLYDIYSLSQIIGATCVLDSMASCSEEESRFMEQNRVNVTTVLQQVAKNKQNGVWGISCLRHQTITMADFFDEKYSVSEYSGYTLNRALGEWLQDQEKDNIHLDLLPWPNNRPCG